MFLAIDISLDNNLISAQRMRRDDVVLIKENSRENKSRDVEKIMKRVKGMIVFPSSIRGRSKVFGMSTF